MYRDGGPEFSPSRFPRHHQNRPYSRRDLTPQWQQAALLQLERTRGRHVRSGTRLRESIQQMERKIRVLSKSVHASPGDGEGDEDKKSGAPVVLGDGGDHAAPAVDEVVAAVEEEQKEQKENVSAGNGDAEEEGGEGRGVGRKRKREEQEVEDGKKRKKVVEEEKSRGRRVFGFLRNHLAASKRELQEDSEKLRRTRELQQQIENKVRKRDAEESKQRIEKLESELKETREELEHVDAKLDMLREAIDLFRMCREQEQRAMMLTTKTNPPLQYLPRLLDPDTQRDIDNKVAKCRSHWRQVRKFMQESQQDDLFAQALIHFHQFEEQESSAPNATESSDTNADADVPETTVDNSTTPTGGDDISENPEQELEEAKE